MMQGRVDCAGIPDSGQNMRKIKPKPDSIPIFTKIHKRKDDLRMFGFVA